VHTGSGNLCIHALGTCAYTLWEPVHTRSENLQDGYFFPNWRRELQNTKDIIEVIFAFHAGGLGL